MTDSERFGRRLFLGATAASAVALAGLTAGQSFDVLAPVNLFAPRTKGEGPQGLPVNRTARQADVVAAASDPDWRLEVIGGTRSLTLSREDLRAFPQHEATLPIACVEGWSTTAHWRGVRVRDLMAAVEARATATVRFDSMQQRGAFRATTMPAEYVRDPLTLVALELNGEPLDIDHGAPARVIAPGRPGVLQTKWLASVREEPA